MTAKNPVRRIRYLFSDDIFESYDSSDYDINASVERYAELCRDALSREYPGANIEVASHTAPCVEVNDRDDLPEVEHIKWICQEVFETRNWVIYLEQESTWLSFMDASNEFSVSVAILRWAVERKLMKDVKKQGAVWGGSYGGIRRFVEQSVVGISPDGVWQVEEDGAQICMFHGLDHPDILDQPCSRFASSIRLLVGDINRFGAPSFFTRWNSFAELVWTKSHVTLITWHFEDVDRWFHPLECSFSKFCRNVVREAQEQGLEAEAGEDGDAKHLFLTWMKIHERFEVSSSLSLRDILERHAGKLNVIVDAAHLTIAGGPKWKEEYTTNEQLFCEEMLTKLLQRMGFKDIQYRHGSREFGKDFTFTEVTSIGPRYYALQAKAGNISGSVQGDMDIILGQMEDAFTIPYRYPPGTGEHRFISAFIIAISGKFTNNAEEKIRWKLLKMGRMGVVYLWDRQKILEMIHRLWLSENNSRDVNAWEVRMEFLRNS